MRTPSMRFGRWRSGLASSTSAASGSGPRRQPAPQHLALLRLDISALWRGYVQGDELCEITGLGPIPVATAKGCWATPS